MRLVAIDDERAGLGIGVTRAGVGAGQGKRTGSELAQGPAAHNSGAGNRAIERARAIVDADLQIAVCSHVYGAGAAQGINIIPCRAAIQQGVGVD